MGHDVLVSGICTRGALYSDALTHNIWAGKMRQIAGRESTRSIDSTDAGQCLPGRPVPKETAPASFSADAGPGRASSARRSHQRQAMTSDGRGTMLHRKEVDLNVRALVIGAMALASCRPSSVSSEARHQPEGPGRRAASPMTQRIFSSWS